MRTALVDMLIISFCLAVSDLKRGNAEPVRASARTGDQPELAIGFGEAEITPKLGEKPVFMAGFGQNRKATGVHDPLMARSAVLRHGNQKIALVSIDVVGFFNRQVLEVRKELPGFTYVLVSSTHNHEGPDTLGLWGPNPFTKGTDPKYLSFVQAQIVQAVKAADKSAKRAVATIGTAKAPDLLHDGREPYIKHDELVALQFTDPGTGKTIGIIVQWNCHPETLESKNTQISADFVGYTVKEISEKHHCPVLYLTGTVGGLMTSLAVEIKDDQGKRLADGTFAKTERYGRLVGQLATTALADAQPLALIPFQVRSRDVYLPLYNKTYQMGRKIGILDAPAFLWKGDPYQAAPADPKEFKQSVAIKTEVGWLRLGQLDIAAIPGEIYPELVLDKVQDPADPGADFPAAPMEPAIYKQLKNPYHMIVGLANDEIGYIIPKRQWDEKAPFCYGRKSAQYGEGNSVGPDTAPFICQAFKSLTEAKK